MQIETSMLNTNRKGAMQTHTHTHTSEGYHCRVKALYKLFDRKIILDFTTFFDAKILKYLNNSSPPKDYKKNMQNYSTLF